MVSGYHGTDAPTMLCQASCATAPTATAVRAVLPDERTHGGSRTRRRESDAEAESNRVRRFRPVRKRCRSRDRS